MSDNQNTIPEYYTAERLDGGTRETIQSAINELDTKWRSWADEATRPRARLILGGTFTLDRALRLRCPIDIVGVEGDDGGDDVERPILQLRSPKPFMQCFRFFKNEGVNDVTLRGLRVHGYSTDPNGVTFAGNTLVWRPSRIGQHAPIKEKALMADVRGWRVEGCELWRCGITFSRDYGFTRDIEIIDTEIHDHEGIGIMIEGVQHVLIDGCTIHNIRHYGIDKKGNEVVRNVTFGAGIKLNTRHYTADTAQFDFNAPAFPPLITAKWSHSGEVLAEVLCSQTRHVTIKNTHVYNCEDDGIVAMIADLEVVNCQLHDNDENGIEVKTSGRFIVNGQWVDGEWDIIENAGLIDNHVYRNGKVTEENPGGANGIVCSVPGTLLLNNVSENNWGDGIQVSRMNGRKSLWNITVVGNRSVGNGGDGIQVTEHETDKTNRVRIVGNDVRKNKGYGISVGKSRFVQVGIADLDALIYHQWADGRFLTDDDDAPLPVGSARESMSGIEEAYSAWSNVIINNQRGGIHLQHSEAADIHKNLIQSDTTVADDNKVKRYGIDANQTERAHLHGNRCVGQEIGVSANYATACRIDARNYLEENGCNLHLHETTVEAFAGNVIGRSHGNRSIVMVRVTGIDSSETAVKQENAITGKIHIMT